MSVVPKPSSHLPALSRNLKSEGSGHLALKSPGKQERELAAGQKASPEGH